MADISFRRLKVGDVSLHIALAGPSDGKPILFLHGFPDFWYGWRKQIKYFASKGYQVIAPDLRGYNKSDKPNKTSDYTVPKIAGDVEKLIETLSLTDVTLVGHDWGGVIAWWLAANRENLFKRVVIINVPHPNVMWKNLKTNPKQMAKSWYIAFFQLPKLPEAMMKLPILSRLSQSLLKSSSGPGTFSREDLKIYRKAWSQPGAAKSMLNFYRAAARSAILTPSEEASPKETQKVGLPLLMVWGVHDVAFVSCVADESLEYCHDGRLEKIDASHWVHVEKDVQTNTLIETFIKDLS